MSEGGLEAHFQHSVCLGVSSSQEQLYKWSTVVFVPLLWRYPTGLHRSSLLVLLTVCSHFDWQLTLALFSFLIFVLALVSLPEEHVGILSVQETSNFSPSNTGPSYLKTGWVRAFQTAKYLFMILVALVVLSKYGVIDGGILFPSRNTPGSKQCMLCFLQCPAPSYESRVQLCSDYDQKQNYNWF